MSKKLERKRKLEVEEKEHEYQQKLEAEFQCKRDMMKAKQNLKEA